MKKFISLSLILLIPVFSFSQDEEEVEWASASVEGMTTGKGIVFSYRRLSPYDVVSESQVPDLVSDSRGDIDRIMNLTFKLRAPVLLKEQTQVVVGLEYRVDEFEFNAPDDITYPFYEQLHHKPLRGRGIRFYLNHSLTDRKFIFTRLGVDLNGDIPHDWYRTLRYTFAGTYGWKIDPTKSVGVGLYFSYSFGRPLIFPAMLYNKTWSKNWGIEALFPALVQLRYNLNNKNIFYLGYDVGGGTYNIDIGETLNQRFDDVQLRRSELTPFIKFEREVYDFIWLSLHGGYRYNINFNVTEDNFFDERVILANEVQSGFFIEGSLFIIPTESLKRLIKKKNK
ncbi:MAG: DUF6268 family outer membrane beta-barrel protein [Candidatus Cyclobacteriaceae bacterium M2_1C_046]